MITVEKVSDKLNLDDFINYPYQLFHQDRYWVPPLKISEKKRFDRVKNPFYKNFEVKFHLARNGEKIEGRIASLYDKRSSKGYFGYLHAIDDQDVFDHLFHQVEMDMSERNIKEITGPVSPSINYEMGVLTAGFEHSPFIMMPYNYDYYDHNIQRAGYSKVKDFYAYQAHRNEIRLPNKIKLIAERIKNKFNLTLRNPNMNDFYSEILKIEGVYNDAMSKHWGFVPMDSDEFRHLAKDLRTIIDPKMVFIAEIDDEPIGFIMCLPDYNEIFKKIQNGRLFPTGIVKLLWSQKKIKGLRVVTLGVKNKYQPFGLGSVLYNEAIINMIRSNYEHVEFSWIMEDNYKVRKIAELIGTRIYKTYRVYGKLL
ncbi:GNAT family N-acetyltransferase [Aestuariivivens sediminicola]|uniref:GNAT family N-acetyltransferase n=1 Tax=Aestuariivivens sediminicola TaxID=2913560 RepID=UPI001F5A8B73|nr:GNAT family N-acetyltransferase [Aestuariivivens sediminicola]